MPTELREGVWQVSCTGVNAYLVAEDDGVTLVDAGTRFDATTIVTALESLGYDRSDLQRVLVTHYDVDHVGGITGLPGNVPVYVGRADAPLLTGEWRPSPLGVKGFTQFVTGPLIPTVPNQRIERVDDGQRIGGFDAYHTPGHTPGHTVYRHEARDVAFLGDLVVSWRGNLRPAPWFLCADTAELRRSIDEVSTRLGDFEVAAVGHGSPFHDRGAARLRTVADACR